MAWPSAENHFVGEWKDGLGFFVYPTKRFKTVTIHAAWIRELAIDDRALGASLVQVLRQGTESLPSRTLMETRLENLYGAGFRADVAKLGDKQLLSFHITVVNGQFLPGKPDTVREALDFLIEVLDKPRMLDNHFPADVVEQEKALVKRQIAAIINDKGQYAMSRLMELVADGQRFGLKKLGTMEEVDRISPASLTRFFRAVHQQAPFVFTVVGDVDPEQVHERLTERFQGRRESVATIEPYHGRHQENAVVESGDVRQGKLNMAYRTQMTAQSQGFAALMMYSGILGGFSHSKLFMNVREKASLAYYAYSRVDPALALMTIGAGIEFKDYEAARRIIEEQVTAMRQGEFTDEDVAYTLKAYANDILSEEDSPGQLIGRHMERILIGGGLSGTELIDALEAVTREEVQRAAEQVQLDTVFFLTAEGGNGHGA